MLYVPDLSLHLPDLNAVPCCVSDVEEHVLKNVSQKLNNMLFTFLTSVVECSFKLGRKETLLQSHIKHANLK